MNATAAQYQNCPFGVNTTIELKNIKPPSSRRWTFFNCWK